ncbi:uncharacterized protein [Acropora muricata]|uniref:uncharacterized protein n=1 Tax=Acropora muricata TaxID=159855 RepID=UPI0034E4C02A
MEVNDRKTHWIQHEYFNESNQRADRKCEDERNEMEVNDRKTHWIHHEYFKESNPKADRKCEDERNEMEVNDRKTHWPNNKFAFTKSSTPALDVAAKRRHHCTV